MAELVDAADSKSVVLMDVGVRVSLGAPHPGVIVLNSGYGEALNNFRRRRSIYP